MEGTFLLEKEGLQVMVGSEAVSINNLADNSDVANPNSRICVNMYTERCPGPSHCLCENYFTADVTIDFGSIRRNTRKSPVDLTRADKSDCINRGDSQCSEECSSCRVYEPKVWAA